MILVPFEPVRLNEREFDSGYQGKGSSSDIKSNSLLKSYLLFVRYIKNDLLFKIKNIFMSYDYVVYTRGILEFGINNSNSKFPKFLSRFYQIIFQKNSVLVVSSIDDIYSRKNELDKSDIIDLYLKYINTNIKIIDNSTTISECAKRVINV